MPSSLHLLGRLEHRRDARTVVVDAGSCVDRVQVSADHHGPIGAAARGLGDHVVGQHVFVDEAVHLHAQGDPAGVGEIDERAAGGVVGSHDRDCHVVAGQGWDQHVIAVRCADRALVEDHGADGARLARDSRPSARSHRCRVAAARSCPSTSAREIACLAAGV